MSAMHLEDERLQRLLHGQLGAAGAAEARDHLGGCGACRDRAERWEREEAAVHRLLRLADHPAPAVTAADLARRAGAGARARWGRWAAGGLLAVCLAGAAYAVPGSPVPRWLDAVGGLLGGGGPAAPVPVPPPATGTSGIAVLPGAMLVIEFQAPAGTLVEVSLTGGEEVAVRSRTGSAAFLSGQGRLTVRAADSAVFDTRIPRTAPRVEIRAAGRVLFSKDGERISTALPDGTGGTWRLRLEAP